MAAILANAIRLAGQSEARSVAIDAGLLMIWAGAWAASRGVPPPVRNGNVMTTEVGLPDQLRRHMLLDPPHGLAALVAGIATPFILIKAPVSADAMRPHLSLNWDCERTGTFMTIDHLPRSPLETMAEIRQAWSHHGATLQIDLFGDGPESIGKGRLTVIDRHAVYDQIIIAPAHRRKGLGRIIMAALTEQALHRGATDGLLTATDAGRALYEGLGWQARAPWTTAEIRA